MIRGFTVKNRKSKLIRLPKEDSYSIGEKKRIFAVADGITRDCKNNAVASSNPKSALNIFWKYPRPSPAKIVADIFCKIAPKVLKDYIPENRDRKAIRQAFEESNQKIKEYQKKFIPNINYLANDFPGCVATLACHNTKENIIHYGFVSDCGISIFDEKGDLKFKTKDEGPHCKEKNYYLEKIVKENGVWENSEARKIIRSRYRNNPSEPHSFGALTGEDNVMHYVRTGTQELTPGEYLIAYSDGLEKIIFSKEFIGILKTNNIKNIKNLCQQKVKSEGTLIISN